MSQTRIICDDCGFIQIHCTCKPNSAKRFKISKREGDKFSVWDTNKHNVVCTSTYEEGAEMVCNALNAQQSPVDGEISISQKDAHTAAVMCRAITMFGEDKKKMEHF